MEMMQNAVSRGLLLLVTVSGALACEPRAPLDADPTTPVSQSNNSGTVVAGKDAGASTATGAGGDNGMGTSTDASVGTDAATDAAPPASTAALMQEVMRRWNATVDSGNWSIDFHWNVIDQFPHPTFKFGTAEAYGEFASVLLAFFQAGDNFDFMAQNHLFTAEVRADTVSGQGDVVTSFEQLADYFSSSTAFGDITPDVRAGLAQFARQIHQAT